MSPAGIRTHNLNRRAAADLRLRPRSHWDRQGGIVEYLISEEERYEDRKYNRI
jgi:hypothetical protein